MKKPTYFLVLCLEGENNLTSSDLFINDIEGAKRSFITKIRELNSKAFTTIDMDEVLDEGWYSYNGRTVLYTEPFNIIGKE